MLTPATRLRLQAILNRIGNDEPVTLPERIDVQKFANHDATYRPGSDDIEDWFGGAPGWLRRS